MEVQFGPNSVDEPNLLYKLQRKIKVFNINNPLKNRGYNLVTCSSKYGLVFVASPNGILSAYSLKDLIDKENEPKHHAVKLEVEPTHISVNCDQEWLAVIGGQKLYIYKVSDFQSQNVLPSGTLNCNVNPGTYVSVLQWNPCIPETIAIVFFDGTLIVVQVNTMQMKKLQSSARCLCWSPKGKQLVTGNNDGTLCQFKPDLSPMKMVPAPKLFEGAPVEALAIYWISTYQFAVVFKNALDDSRPAVTIVNTPKGGQPACYNYEDICYSFGSSRPWYYYLHGITQWNMILSSSSNSMEIATLGSADGASWLQWCQTDEARPELPLTDKKQENYPVGLSIDTCAVHQLPWGENEVLPTMPLLHVLSQTGLLSIFNIIYLNKAAPQICMPPQLLTLPAAVMTSEIPDDTPSQPTQPPPMYPGASEVQQSVIQQQVTQIQSPAPEILQVPQISTSSFFSQPNIQVKQFEVAQTQPNLGLSVGLPPEQEQLNLKPAELQTQLELKLNEAPPAPPQPSQSELEAALKSEQQRDDINKAQMNKELTDMLIKEVNEFQMELYKFTMKTKKTESQLQRDMQNISIHQQLMSLDTERLIKECTLDNIHTSIDQLKLELVKACAVVAEARSQPENKELPHWAQADPLTAKRVAGIRKLAYYVQNQLDQARKALDLKWSEIKNDDPDDRQGRMIRPILDEVYQPLVKQQEILLRQQAVLRSMKSTLMQCELGPVFKSSSILRTTPFKKDLSKLTKNVINMKIEAEENSTTKEITLSPQKLDALRDVLSNHKPIKVKPINVELRHQLATMYKNYKNNVVEKVEPNGEFPIKSEPIETPVQIKAPPPTPVMKSESTPDIIKESPKSYAPMNDMKPAKTGLAGVARTLFTDEPKVEQSKAPFSTSETSNNTTISANTKNLLKDLLQTKSQAAANVEAKNDANTFMGQNICSPTAFNFSKPPTAAAPSAIFPSKPGTFTNIFGKYQQSNAQTESKPETSLAEAFIESPDNKPKEEKSMTNLFALKSPTTRNVPDVLKNNAKAFNFGKLDPAKITITPVSEADSKENVPEKTIENEEPSADKTEISAKTDYMQFGKTPSIPSPQPISTIIVDLQKDKGATKAEISPPVEKSPSIIFGAANNLGSKATSVTQPSILFGSTSNVSKSTIITPLPSATSIFGANGTQKSGMELNTATPAGPIFSSTVCTTGTFGVASGQPSIFASSATPQSSTFNLSTAQSVFSSANQTMKNVFGSSASVTSESETTTTQSPAEKLQPSAFSTSSAASSVFASATASAFGTKSSTQSSIFGTSSASTVTTTAESVFGTSTTTTSSAQSVFSAAVSKAAFGSEATTQPIFGATPTTTQSSIFGSTMDPKSVFGSTSTPAAVFGASTTLSPRTSVFGTATQSPASVFGTTTTQAPLFGATSSTQSSIFAAPSATTQASVFGAPNSQATVFGSPASTQASVFGTPPQKTQTSVFEIPKTTQSASPFGGAETSFFSTATTTQAPVFGSPTQTSVFGASATTQANVFGTPTASTQASVFGVAASPQPSVFGAPSPTTQTSVFEMASTTTQSASPFGGAESNLFAAASISTSNANSQSGGNIFGGGSGSVFNSNTPNIFGGKSTFGQSNPTAATIFGGTTEAKGFGQKPATDFWGGANKTATSGFGSGFGQTATTQASSIFGSSTGGSFSAPAAGPTFGSPQPTAFGASEVKPSVFGSPQQTNTPAFGGSPVFGSKPVFGQSSGFGSPSAGTGFGSFGGFNKSPTGFGGSATFGSGAMFGGAAFGNTSPGKVFGGSPPSFAQPAQSNATFESLATQNTLTFGNLAQQSGQPQAASPPSFNASPSFTGWRG